MVRIEELFIKWGVFEFDYEVHVAPCDNEGHVLKGHTFDELCECNPIIEATDNRHLIIHDYLK